MGLARHHQNTLRRGSLGDPDRVSVCQRSVDIFNDEVTAAVVSFGADPGLNTTPGWDTEKRFDSAAPYFVPTLVVIVQEKSPDAGVSRCGFL